jgi:PAS domain S-box-containing protein
MSVPLNLPPLIHDHPLPTWSYDKKTFAISAANKAATQQFGYSKLAWIKLSVPDFLTMDGDGVQKEAFSGTAVSKQGEKFNVKGNLRTISEKNRKYNLLILHDIQPQGAGKNREDDLEARHSRLDKIVRVIYNEIYLVHDSTLAFEYANIAALRNLGYAEDELKGMRLTDLFNFPDEMALKALLNSLRRAETDHLQLQLKYTRKNGSHYDADVLIQVLEKDKLLLLMVTDITDKLVTEKKLLETIHEKETLIKEIHHRVKNNLQLISSIIYLKLVSLRQSDIRNFLEDTRQKIRSIALIHERLLQTEKLDKVEISDYLGKLIHDLQVTYYRQDLALDIQTRLGNQMIGLDTAIICGLIVNELVTNAIKHAFNGRSKGLIVIEFVQQEENRFVLSVEDDGVSLPAHIRPGHEGSFGMQLIDVFVKQLGGSFELFREKGTKFQIRF